ncbi:probable ribose-5-phosphate isomerase 2 [Juglans microcarpa x Juglans regia]|uniref:probable ribose-5-phosphate isomerase 2 n=1 Tax=Juglans microcarpa x Juglans regia TaxID=2249226 RepID=UPI001B7D9CC2|nr:probable ribose-5-phosphate isomerase 2 [Juglans microcarpa x Juglans regia]
MALFFSLKGYLRVSSRDYLLLSNRPPKATKNLKPSTSKPDLKLAMEYVESGMILRLGVDIGSTSKHAVDHIGELLRQGKLHSIVGISTSEKAHDQAISLDIPLSDLDVHLDVNLAISNTEVEAPLFGSPADPISDLLPTRMVWHPHGRPTPSSGPQLGSSSKHMQQ